MQDVKISLVTVTLNAGNTIRRCIESVISQTFTNIEYIVIDGQSADKTIHIINEYKHHIAVFLSEPDNGIYDAMNKGVRLATGNVIGMLNADDFFAGPDILAEVASLFSGRDIDIVYGDLDYIDNSGNTFRKWRSGPYTSRVFTRGWMPPHPTFYCKKALFDKYGYYDVKYGTAADYELMLRFMHVHKVKAAYLSKVLVMMQSGGQSNKSFRNRIKGSLNDLKAMRANSIVFPISTLVFKVFRKIFQYF